MTQIIGRVAVQLIPETKAFRTTARAELTKIESQLPKVKIGATFNEAGLKAELARSLRALNAGIRNDDRFKVRLGAKIEARRADVRSAVRELTALASAERIRFRADVSSVLIEGDLDQTSLRSVERDLQRWRDEISPLRISVIPELLNGAGALVSARLAALTRPRTVEIIPKLNSTGAATVATALAALSGGRVLWNTLDGLWSRLARLDQSVPIIGTVAEAIAGLAAWTLAGAGNLFALAQSLAQIGPAALALPGIFGGIALGIGTTVAALRDFNTVFPDFKSKLTELQDSISTEFWASAEAPMRRMIDTLFPLFFRELTQTGAELGAFFGSMGDSLTAILGPALAGMFADLHESIAIASRFTDSFVQILTVLGSVGAGYLPRLAQWFGEIAQSFGSWLTGVQADGRLTEWIDHGIFELQELGRAVGNIGGIFAGLASVAEAAGGSTLTTFANTLQSIEDTVKGSTFQTVMTAALKAAYDGMEAITQTSGPAFKGLLETLGRTATVIFPMMGATVGRALQAIFDGLNQPEVMSGLVTMFAGLQAGWTALAPALAPVGRAFGSLLSLVGSFAAVLGPLLGAALSGLADTVVTLTPALTGLIAMLGEGLLSIVSSAGPLTSLGGTLRSLFTGTILPAFQQLIPVITQVAAAVLPLLIDGFTRIIEALAPLIAKVAEFIALIAPVLIPVLTILAGILIDTIVLAVTGVVNVISGLIDIFSGLIDFVVGVFTGDWGRAWDGIKTVFTGVIDLIKGAFQVFIAVGMLGILRAGLSVIRGLWSGAWGAIKGAAEAIWKGLQGGYSSFGNALRSVTGNFLNGIRGLFSTIWNAIRTVVSTVWNAITSATSTATSRVSSAVSTGFNAVRTFISNAMDRARTIVGSAWDAIRNAASNGVGRVIDLVGSMPGRAVAALAGIGSALYAAGSGLIQGFLNGITSKIGAVRDKLGELTAMIPKIKGPLPYDRVMLIPAGRAIMDGLLEGLTDGWRDVEKALDGMTEQVAGTHIDGPTVGGIGGNLGALIDGSIDDSPDGGESRTLIYNAAPGSSLDSEEDLFAAADRGRMVGW